MSNYRLADTQSQWFADDFPGDKMNLTADTAVTVLHTTESSNWPGYEGGATAPTYTAFPDIVNKRMKWRGHFPDEMSSRALKNLPGGVETNTLNCVQVELVGTCDPSHKFSWNGKKAGVDYIYWPDAPAWALLAVARFLVDQNARHGLVLKSLAFQPYPASAGPLGGTNTVRMTFSQWRNFVGVCGHQHVPENTHGDPGDIDILKVLAYANEFITPSLRVVTANLKQGNKQLDAALTLLRKQQADVIFFQEVDTIHAKIRAALPNHTVFFASGGVGAKSTHGSREVGVAVRKHLSVVDHGHFQATVKLEAPHNIAHDRWVQWVDVKWQGRKFSLIGWHGNAAIQDPNGNPILKAQRVVEYIKEIKQLEALICEKVGKGFGPIVGGDTNYSLRPWLKAFIPWFNSPDSMYKRQGLTTESRRFDKVAYPKGFTLEHRKVLRAPGCDHDWLIVDLEKA